MTDVLLNPGPTNTRFRTKYAQWISSDVCHRTEDFMTLLGETKNLLLNDFTNHNIAILAGLTLIIRMYTSLKMKPPLVKSFPLKR